MSIPVKIKRSYTQVAFAGANSLSDGELGYLYSTNTFYIGNSTGSSIPIGGTNYSLLSGLNPGVAQPSTIVSLDANGLINKWAVGNTTANSVANSFGITVSNSVATAVYAANILLSGVGSNTTITSQMVMIGNSSIYQVSNTINVLLTTPTSNTLISASILSIGNSSVNTVVNSTAISTTNISGLITTVAQPNITANNANYLGGLPYTSYAVLASPTFTGTITSPALALGSNGVANSSSITFNANSTTNTALNSTSLTLASALYTTIITPTTIQARDVVISGNLTVSGTTTTSSTTQLTITDTFVQIAANNTSSDSIDFGLFGEYTTANVIHYSGLGRTASDGKWRIFTNAPAQPGATMNVSVLATFVANSIELSNPLKSNYGGTGVATFVANSVAYAINTTALGFASGNQGQVLVLDANSNPTFITMDGGVF